MILADKEKIERDYRVRMLEIRSQELNYYIANAQQVATLSALLLGLSCSGLIDTATPEFDITGNNVFLFAEKAQPIFIVVNIGISTFCCWGSMLVALLAPRLALYGPPSQFSYLVDAMEEEFDYIMHGFVASAVTFSACALSWAWACLPLTTAVVVSVAWFVSGLAIRVAYVYVYGQFSVPSEKVVNGRWFMQRLARSSPRPAEAADLDALLTPRASSSKYTLRSLQRHARSLGLRGSSRARSDYARLHDDDMLSLPDDDSTAGSYRGDVRVAVAGVKRAARLQLKQLMLRHLSACDGARRLCSRTSSRVLLGISRSSLKALGNGVSFKRIVQRAVALAMDTDAPLRLKEATSPRAGAALLSSGVGYVISGDAQRGVAIPTAAGGWQLLMQPVQAGAASEEQQSDGALQEALLQQAHLDSGAAANKVARTATGGWRLHFGRYDSDKPPLTALHYADGDGPEDAPPPLSALSEGDEEGSDGASPRSSARSSPRSPLRKRSSCSSASPLGDGGRSLALPSPRSPRSPRSPSTPQCGSARGGRQQLLGESSFKSSAGESSPGRASAASTPGRAHTRGVAGTPGRADASHARGTASAPTTPRARQQLTSSPTATGPTATGGFRMVLTALPSSASPLPSSASPQPTQQASPTATGGFKVVLALPSSTSTPPTQSAAANEMQMV